LQEGWREREPERVEGGVGDDGETENFLPVWGLTTL
jgi:hypothetical protein